MASSIFAVFLEGFIKGGEDECWIWYKTLTNNRGFRYGVFKLGDKNYRAHVVSYEHYKGSTNGLCVLHTCDTPACVNPKHLFLGTRGDNCKDAGEKGRMLYGESSPQAKHTLEEVHRVLELRKQGLTTRQVAAIIGVSCGQVSKIGTGKSWRRR